MNVTSLRLLMGFLLVFVSNLLLGQSDSKIDSANLSIEVKYLRTNDVAGSKSTLVISIINHSKESLNLDSLRVILPGELSDFYTVEAPVIGAPIMLGKSIGNVIVPLKPSRATTEVFDLSTITFLPRQYEVTLDIFYHQPFELAPKDPSKLLIHESRIYYRPPVSSLIIGGILGAFLLTLFLVLVRLKNDGNKPEFWDNVKANYGKQMLKTFVLFAFGSIVSAITILMIQRISNFELPISIKVEDYLGGVIIGLFSSKLGDSLKNTFL